MRLGVDPEAGRPDSSAGRSSCRNGLGRTLQVHVVVFAKGDKIEEAEEAGADEVGGEGFGRIGSRTDGPTSTPASPRLT